MIPLPTEYMTPDQRQALFEGPYGWRDCETCGNFLAPGEEVCSGLGCIMIRVARKVGEEMAQEHENRVLAAILGDNQ